MADDARTDAELLAAAADEAEAFGVFYRRHVDWVLGYLARRLGDRETVADLAAESFAAALIGLDRYDERRGPPAAWLFGIVANQLSRHRRKGHVEDRARRRLGLSVPPPPSDELLDRLAGDVSAILDLLPEDPRTAVHRRILDDREYGEIAVELGLSESAVRQRVSRGLRTLRHRMETEGE